MLIYSDLYWNVQILIENSDSLDSFIRVCLNTIVALVLIKLNGVLKMKLTDKKINSGELAMIKVRRMVEEMREIVERKEYAYLMSKTDRQWLDGISTRLGKKAKLMSGGE